MAVSALLAAWVVAVTALSPRLARASWPSASPRLALLTWQVLFVSAAQAAVLFAMVSWHDGFEPIAAWFFHARDDQIDDAYGLVHVGGMWSIAALVLLVFLHLLVVACREGWDLATARRAHRQGLDLVAPGGRGAFVLLEHDVPVVYCVPGWHPRVVVSRGAFDCLSTTELRAALAHERAHLRGRHHWLHLVARTCRRALPWLPVTAAFEREIGRLIEMAADDVAARSHGGRTTARALIRISTGGLSPVGTLGAASGDVVDRVQRLVSRPRMSVPARAASTLSVLALIGLPLAGTALPGVDAFGSRPTVSDTTHP